MCYQCDGSGILIVCVDDMCRGAGECMHGDGEIPCPCGGDDDYDDDIYFEEAEADTEKNA